MLLAALIIIGIIIPYLLTFTVLLLPQHHLPKSAWGFSLVSLQ